MSTSWHIPTVSTFNLPPPNGILHVIFLQRMPKRTRQQFLQRLSNFDAASVKDFDPSGEFSRPREMKVIPWIRDSWPSSQVILQILSTEPDKYKSYILVDSLWEASTVVAAHWHLDQDGEPKLDAARVSMSMANIVLTLIDNGKASGLREVLGEVKYEENKVDFYTDVQPIDWTGSELEHYKWPAHLPAGLKLDRSKIEIIALRQLEPDAIETLKRDILHSSGDHETTPSILIHNWQGPSPSRSELGQLLRRLRENSTEADRSSVAWFVDSILENDGHLPRVVALASYDLTRAARLTTPLEVTLLPLDNNSVLPLFNDCKKFNAGSRYFDKPFESCIPKEKEPIVTTRNPISFGDDACPVFYLSSFTVDQERTIRAALNNVVIMPYGNADTCFTYYGYMFADSGSHTISDLCELFQRCDPYSPTFDPQSKMRFKDYPGTFIAVDSQCLDAEDPRVFLADAEFSSFSPPENGASDKVGWRYCTTEPSMAWPTYEDLVVAQNADPEALFGDHETLYLRDLEGYKDDMRKKQERRMLPPFWDMREDADAYSP